MRIDDHNNMSKSDPQESRGAFRTAHSVIHDDNVTYHSIAAAESCLTPAPFSNLADGRRGEREKVAGRTTNDQDRASNALYIQLMTVIQTQRQMSLTTSPSRTVPQRYVVPGVVPVVE